MSVVDVIGNHRHLTDQEAGPGWVLNSGTIVGFTPVLLPTYLVDLYNGWAEIKGLEPHQLMLLALTVFQELDGRITHDEASE